MHVMKEMFVQLIAYIKYIFSRQHVLAALSSRSDNFSFVTFFSWGLVASIHGRCSLTKLVIIKNILSFIASLFEIIVNHSKCTIIKYDDF